jgi:hypothetical protein
VSNPETDAAVRLAAAARNMRSLEERRSHLSANVDILRAEPRDVFLLSLSSLRDKALRAESWGPSEPEEFTHQLGLLVAGLRTACGADSTYEDNHGDECCRRCEELLAQCQQPDPETGQPHLDCFMVYADCLFRCSAERDQL